MEVYDTTDPDWTLVGYEDEYGFAPALYIEQASDAQSVPSAPAMPARHQMQQPTPEPEYEQDEESPPMSPAQNPARALAGIIAQRTGQSQAMPDREIASPPLPQRPQYTPEESDEEGPAPPMPM